MSSVVPRRLQVISRPLIFKKRGRTSSQHAIAATPVAVNEKRVIDAEIIHNGDEQAFWGERRWFYRHPLAYMPTWDRTAQTLILMTRRVPRVPQEAAFRLFSVFMKVLLITKVTDVTSMMLPLWPTMNIEGLVRQAKEDAAHNETKEGSNASVVEPKVAADGATAAVEAEDAAAPKGGNPSP